MICSGKAVQCYECTRWSSWAPRQGGAAGRRCSATKAQGGAAGRSDKAAQRECGAAARRCSDSLLLREDGLLKCEFD